MSKTNAQKYEEVFGFPPDKVGCPTKECGKCPVSAKGYLSPCASEDWWDSEYEEVGIPDEELEHRTVRSEDALKEIKETGHGCKTCKYGQKWLTEEPCSSCDIRLGNNKWEPEEGDGDKS